MQYIIQISLAFILMTSIILQAKGTGLGSSMGGNSLSYHSKRGLEKTLFFVTIVTAIIFVVVSAINAFK